MTLATAFTLAPDELLYSALARYADAMCYPRQRAVLTSAFGRSTQIAVIDLPGHLGALWERLPRLEQQRLGDSAALVYAHTLLPYYTPFQPTGRAALAEAQMIAGRAGSVHSLLGIRASRVIGPTHLQYCPLCVTSDRATIGAAYWHRCHQLPGSMVCVHHAEPLVPTVALRSSARRRLVFVSAEWALRRASRRAVLSPSILRRCADPLLALAEDAAALLSRTALATADEPGGTPEHALCLLGLGARTAESIRQSERVLLEQKEWIRPSGRARLQALAEQVRKRFGSELLRMLGCSLDDTTGDHWLARLLRRPGTANHPLRHLLLLHAMGYRVTDVMYAQTPPTTSANGESPVKRHIDRGDLEVPPPQMASGDTADNRDVKILPSRSPEWTTQLVHLVTESQTSLRGIAVLLEVDPRTVQRHARRLGVWRVGWSTWEQSDRGTKRLASVSSTRVKHRLVWKALARSLPPLAPKAMRRSAPSTYSYLYRYDRVWLTTHTPAVPIPLPRRPVVDWSRRDYQLRKRAADSINALRNGPGRPVRLRFTTIARHMGCATLLERRDVPLPRTLALIRASVESPLDAARRRIVWASAQLAAAGARPARWQVVRAAGLRPAVAEALTSELDAAMHQIWTTYPSVAVVAPRRLRRIP